MKPIRTLSLMGALLALLATTFVFAGSTGLFPQEAEAQSAECVATGSTLNEARTAHQASCSAPRFSCNQIGDIWRCSSAVDSLGARGERRNQASPSLGPAEPPAEAPCVVTSTTLTGARAIYQATCSAPRVDCDKVADIWYCSSAEIPDINPDDTPTPEPTTPPPTPTPTQPPAEAPCVVTSTTLTGARAIYQATCSAPRVDCDKVADIWYCSSAEIPDINPDDTPTSTPTPEPTTPPPTPTPTQPPAEAPCVVTSTTLTGARAIYQATCSAPRVDCDKVADIWYCSSAEIPDINPDDTPTSTPTPEPTTPPPTPTPTQPPAEAPCVVTSTTLTGARAIYQATCSAPRVDCDKVADIWYCSSAEIPDINPDDTPTSTPTPEPTTPPPTPTPTQPPAEAPCVVTSTTLTGARAIYQATCSAPRVDCDKVAYIWYCSSAEIPDINPDDTPTSTPTPEPTTPPPTPTPTDSDADSCSANTSGTADLDRDLVSLHYDHAPDMDDGHATVAGKEVATTLGFTPWVIGGAYGVGNAITYRSASEQVMDAVWGSENWVNADANWNAAVQLTADRWQVTLEACGDIWIAEGGQSDLTADIIRELKQRIAGLETTARIHLVQHSRWNEVMALDSDLEYVKQSTDYIYIPDGNGLGNGTAGFNAQNYNGPFINSALDGPNGVGWAAAFAYYSPQLARLDFSDTVELMAIVGIGTDEVNTVEEFADRFIR